MIIEDLQEVGYTKKAHGLKGELKIHVEKRYMEDFLTNEVVLISDITGIIPYFIENTRIGNEIIVKFEGVDDVNSAKALQSKKLYFPQMKILKMGERTIVIPNNQFLDIEGFKVEDINIGYVGILLSTQQLPGQLMGYIQTDKGEKAIPMVDAFVIQIDRKSKKLILNLPEGLLNLSI